MRFALEVCNILNVAVFAELLELHFGREQRGRRGNSRSALFLVNCELHTLFTL